MRVFRYAVKASKNHGESSPEEHIHGVVEIVGGAEPNWVCPPGYYCYPGYLFVDDAGQAKGVVFENTAAIAQTRLAADRTNLYPENAKIIWKWLRGKRDFATDTVRWLT